VQTALTGTSVLLTSDYPVYRAVPAFRRAGLEAVAGPFPDAGKRATGLAGHKR